MSNIDSKIAGAIQLLRDAKNKFTAFRGSSSTFKMAESVYGSWEKRLGLYEHLSVTKDLIAARSDALSDLQSLMAEFDKKPGLGIHAPISYNGRTASISHLRLLALQAYLATTWSIYDRLSGVVGRLIGSKGMVDNEIPHNQAKLVEQLLEGNVKSKDSCDACALRRILDEVYAWDIVCSYQIRNAFMHDGGFIEYSFLIDETTAERAFLFAQKGLDSLMIAIDRRIERKDGSGKIVGHPCKRTVSVNDTIINLLRDCNENIDEAIGALLTWSVRSFVSQVVAFAEVDGFSL